MIEVSVGGIVTCLTTANQRGADRIEADADAQLLDFEENTRGAREGSIHYVGNCGGSNSYYYDTHGDTHAFRHTNHAKEWWLSRNMAQDMEGFRITSHQVPSEDSISV